MSQGVTVVENMDDGEELQITDVSGPSWLACGRESQDRDCGGPACTVTWGGDPDGVGTTPSSQAIARILSWRSLGLQPAPLSPVVASRTELEVQGTEGPCTPAWLGVTLPSLQFLLYPLSPRMTLSTCNFCWGLTLASISDAPLPFPLPVPTVKP